MRRARAGLSVLELMIAGALLSGLLGLLGSFLHNTRQAYDGSERVSARQGALEAATELLSYELGLAGYRGTDAAYASRDFGGLPPLEVAATNDQITVRYYEDRFQSTPKLNEVAFKIKSDGSALVRKAGNSTFQEAARGISGLEVTTFYLRDGTLSGNLPNLADLAGMSLRLTLEDGSFRDLSISFENDLTL